MLVYCRKLLIIISFLSPLACQCGQKPMKKISLSSTAFSDKGKIPEIYTCQGQDYSPPLSWENIPPKTLSLALIVEDPDAPTKEPFVHWIAWNINPASQGLSENTLAADKNIVQGMNNSNKIGYKGPCPPSGTHRYYFKLYALDTKLELAAGASKADLEKAMQKHILQETTLLGLFKKN